MITNSEYLSKERLEEIKAELVDLKTNKRKEIAERLGYAKSLGDLSENAEYKEAKEALDMLEEKIARLDDIVRRAVIITKHKCDSVQIGCEVKIDSGKEDGVRIFQIVGPEEVDIAKGKLSNQSPIGVALMGKKKGDEIIVDSPSGKIKYKIIELL